MSLERKGCEVCILYGVVERYSFRFQLARINGSVRWGVKSDIPAGLVQMWGPDAPSSDL